MRDHRSSASKFRVLEPHTTLITLFVTLCGLSTICDDEHILAVTKPLFDGLYEYFRRAEAMGREPA